MLDYYYSGHRGASGEDTAFMPPAEMVTALCSASASSASAPADPLGLEPRHLKAFHRSSVTLRNVSHRPPYGERLEMRKARIHFNVLDVAVESIKSAMHARNVELGMEALLHAESRLLCTDLDDSGGKETMSSSSRGCPGGVFTVCPSSSADGTVVPWHTEMPEVTEAPVTRISEEPAPSMADPQLALASLDDDLVEDNDVSAPLSVLVPSVPAIPRDVAGVL
ncbi:hypothetical protein EIP86_009054 [Pleurotus ostreatoroseus]|nr:hypothetical protein EIP86_009054 [Pleurotus ostreatoroseus]